MVYALRWSKFLHNWWKSYKRHKHVVLLCVSSPDHVSLQNRLFQSSAFRLLDTLSDVPRRHFSCCEPWRLIQQTVQGRSSHLSLVVLTISSKWFLPSLVPSLFFQYSRFVPRVLHGNFVCL